MKSILLGFVLLVVVSQTATQDYVSILDLAWSPDGERLALATSNGVIVYDMTASQPQVVWSEEVGWTNTVLFSPSGEWLAGGLGMVTGTLDATGLVKVWASASGAEIASFEANDFAVYALAFSPDSARLMSGGGYIPTRGNGDYRVRVWDTETWTEIEALQSSHMGSIQGLAFSPDGQLMASNGTYGYIALRDAETGELLSAVHDEGAVITFSPDSRQLALALWGSFQVWEIRTEPEWHLVQRYIWRLNVTTHPVEWVLTSAFTGKNDGLFITAQSDGHLYVRDLATGEAIATYYEAGRRFSSAAFSPDGEHLAFISTDDWVATSPDYKVVIWALYDDQDTTWITLE
jgi:WD40 repeat protein